MIGRQAGLLTVLGLLGLLGMAASAPAVAVTPLTLYPLTALTAAYGSGLVLVTAGVTVAAISPRLWPAHILLGSALGLPHLLASAGTWTLQVAALGAGLLLVGLLGIARSFLALETELGRSLATVMTVLVIAVTATPMLQADAGSANAGDASWPDLPPSLAEPGAPFVPVALLLLGTLAGVTAVALRVAGRLPPTPEGPSTRSRVVTALAALLVLSPMALGAAFSWPSGVQLLTVAALLLAIGFLVLSGIAGTGSAFRVLLVALVIAAAATPLEIAALVPGSSTSGGYVLLGTVAGLALGVSPIRGISAAVGLLILAVGLIVAGVAVGASSTGLPGHTDLIPETGLIVLTSGCIAATTALAARSVSRTDVLVQTFGPLLLLGLLTVRTVALLFDLTGPAASRIDSSYTAVSPVLAGVLLLLATMVAVAVAILDQRAQRRASEGA